MSFSRDVGRKDRNPLIPASYRQQEDAGLGSVAHSSRGVTRRRSGSPRELAGVVPQKQQKMPCHAWRDRPEVTGPKTRDPLVFGPPRTTTTSKQEQAEASPEKVAEVPEKLLRTAKGREAVSNKVEQNLLSTASDLQLSSIPDEAPCLPASEHAVGGARLISSRVVVPGSASTSSGSASAWYPHSAQPSAARALSASGTQHLFDPARRINLLNSVNLTGVAVASKTSTTRSVVAYHGGQHTDTSASSGGGGPGGAPTTSQSESSSKEAAGVAPPLSLTTSVDADEAGGVETVASSSTAAGAAAPAARGRRSSPRKAPIPTKSGTTTTSTRAKNYASPRKRKVSTSASGEDVETAQPMARDSTTAAATLEQQGLATVAPTSCGNTTTNNTSTTMQPSSTKDDYYARAKQTLEIGFEKDVEALARKKLSDELRSAELQLRGEQVEIRKMEQMKARVEHQKLVKEREGRSNLRRVQEEKELLLEKERELLELEGKQKKRRALLETKARQLRLMLSQEVVPVTAAESWKAGGFLEEESMEEIEKLREENAELQERLRDVPLVSEDLPTLDIAKQTLGAVVSKKPLRSRRDAASQQKSVLFDRNLENHAKIQMKNKKPDEFALWKDKYDPRKKPEDPKVLTADLLQPPAPSGKTDLDPPPLDAHTILDEKLDAVKSVTLRDLASECIEDRAKPLPMHFYPYDLKKPVVSPRVPLSTPHFVPARIRPVGNAVLSSASARAVSTKTTVTRSPRGHPGSFLGAGGGMSLIGSGARLNSPRVQAGTTVASSTATIDIVRPEEGTKKGIASTTIRSKRPAGAVAASSPRSSTGTCGAARGAGASVKMSPRTSTTTIASATGRPAGQNRNSPMISTSSPGPKSAKGNLFRGRHVHSNNASPENSPGKAAATAPSTLTTRKSKKQTHQVRTPAKMSPELESDDFHTQSERKRYKTTHKLENFMIQNAESSPPRERDDRSVSPSLAVLSPTSASPSPRGGSRRAPRQHSPKPAADPKTIFRQVLQKNKKMTNLHDGVVPASEGGATTTRIFSGGPAGSLHMTGTVAGTSPSSRTFRLNPAKAILLKNSKQSSAAVPLPSAPSSSKKSTATRQPSVEFVETVHVQASPRLASEDRDGSMLASSAAKFDSIAARRTASPQVSPRPRVIGGATSSSSPPASSKATTTEVLSRSDQREAGVLMAAAGDAQARLSGSAHSNAGGAEGGPATEQKQKWTRAAGYWSPNSSVAMLVEQPPKLQMPKLLVNAHQIGTFTPRLNYGNSAALTANPLMSVGVGSGGQQGLGSGILTPRTSLLTVLPTNGAIGSGGDSRVVAMAPGVKIIATSTSTSLAEQDEGGDRGYTAFPHVGESAKRQEPTSCSLAVVELPLN